MKPLCLRLDVSCAGIWGRKRLSLAHLRLAAGQALAYPLLKLRDQGGQLFVACWVFAKCRGKGFRRAHLLFLATWAAARAAAAGFGLPALRWRLYSRA